MPIFFNKAKDLKLVFWIYDSFENRYLSILSLNSWLGSAVPLNRFAFQRTLLHPRRVHQ